MRFLKTTLKILGVTLCVLFLIGYLMPDLSKPTSKNLGQESNIEPPPEETKEEKEEKEKKIKALSAKLKKTHDEVEGFTWYRDKETPKYSNVNNINLYFGVLSSGVLTPLRLNIRYKANKWLFIKKYTVKTDDKSYVLVPSKVERDNKGGEIFEWCDEPVENNRLRDIIVSIIESEKTILRSHGGKYYDDRVISKAEKQSMKNVIDLYKALDGDSK